MFFVWGAEAFWHFVNAQVDFYHSLLRFRFRYLRLSVPKLHKRIYSVFSLIFVLLRLFIKEFTSVCSLTFVIPQLLLKNLPWFLFFYQKNCNNLKTLFFFILNCRLFLSFLPDLVRMLLLAAAINRHNAGWPLWHQNMQGPPLSASAPLAVIRSALLHHERRPKSLWTPLLLLKRGPLISKFVSALYFIWYEYKLLLCIVLLCFNVLCLQRYLTAWFGLDS
jgi:hypothetical protein